MPAPMVDPDSFPGMIGEIVAGDSAVGKANFMLPAGTDVLNGSITWMLVDRNGTVYATGNTTNYTINNTSFGTSVSADATITAPSQLPPTSEGKNYLIRWQLTAPAQAQPIFSSEALVVRSLTLVPEGPVTGIEMYGDKIALGIVAPQQYNSVKVEVYDYLNAKVVDDTVVVIPTPQQVAGGWYYSGVIDPNNIPPGSYNPFCARLESYVVSWKYITGTTPNQLTSRQTAELFIVTPSMLAAMDDARRMIMKARTTMFGMPDTMFDDGTILAWLRRGRDLFNSAAGMLTQFTMTKANGGIREYWLQYTEIASLRAQALAEGEKAFNFAGAAITLDVDKTQYYTAAADALQQQIDANIKPFKQNLLKKGAVAGDGNMDGVAMAANSSRLGITIHPASSVRSGSGFIRGF